MNAEYVNLDKGVIDYKVIVDVLRRQGFRGPVYIEDEREGDNVDNMWAAVSYLRHLRGPGGKKVLTGGVKAMKFSYWSKVQLFLNGFEALGADFPKVCALWKESANDPNTVFDCSLILRDIRTSKVGICLESLCHRLMASQGLTIVKDQGFGESRWDNPKVVR